MMLYDFARSSVLPVLFVGLLSSCGTSSEPSTEIEDPWESYEIEPPPQAVEDVLTRPFAYPQRRCIPASEIPNLPADAVLERAEDGTEQLCIWDSSFANVPHGLTFNEVVGCDSVLTQGPSWWAEPVREFESPASLLDDPAYVEELEWVRAQVLTSGCGCCHGSGMGTEHTAGFDASAPAVWTDTMTNGGLALGAGMLEDHILFGYLDPAENQGFDRRPALFGSTDPERMMAFFAAEFERRDGNDDDLESAQALLDSLFGAYREPARECFTEYEGITDGTIIWNGGGVRQLYIQEEGAGNPGFPPHLDRPEGTLWALYVDEDGTPIESGSLSVGEIPSGTRQMVPQDGSVPELVDGQTYRIFGAPDFMIRGQINCTFVYQAPAEG